MKRLHPVLLIAVATLIACNDRSSPTQPIAGAAPLVVRTIDLVGTVVPNLSRELRTSPFLLLEDDGTSIGLTGDQVDLLGAVMNAQVDVTGQLDETNQMLVQSFVVVAVGGFSASDGILEQSDDSTFALRLMRGGYLAVTNPPDELKALVGDRIWLTGADGDTPPTFGVIDDITKVVDASRARKGR